ELSGQCTHRGPRSPAVLQVEDLVDDGSLCPDVWTQQHGLWLSPEFCQTLRLECLVRFRSVLSRLGHAAQSLDSSRLSGVMPNILRIVKRDSQRSRRGIPG